MKLIVPAIIREIVKTSYRQKNVRKTWPINSIANS